jgi:cbb3-type cytochrome oxidase subunit 3
MCRQIGAILPDCGCLLSSGVTVAWMEALMRIALIAMLVALLAVPAYAQRTHNKEQQSEGKQKQTEEQKKKAREAEEAYKAALEKIPDKKPPDPWKNMR